MTSTNYPPQQQPMTTDQGTVSRAWLRYFLGLGNGGGPSAAVPAPGVANALDFIRINAAGTAYETQTPAQVLQDIGGLSLAEAETLFEPLLDIYDIHHGTYSVLPGDTGRAILMLGSPAIVRLSASLAQGTKIVVSAGDVGGCLITGNGVSLINGVISGSVELSLGQSAACELMGDGLWSVTFGPIQGSGAPTFYAPPGVTYSRNDDASQKIDRVYVSNGTYPYLAAVQISDGATHQYLFNETSGAVAVDTVAAANGTYNSPFTLAGPNLVPGAGDAVIFGNAGYATFPFNDFYGTNQAFSFEFVAGALNEAITGTSPHIFMNGNPSASSAGFCFFSGSSSTPSGFGIGTSGGYSQITGYIPPVGNGLTHLVCVYDGATLFLYANGALVASGSAAGTYVPSTQNASLNFDPVAGIGNGPETYQALAVYNRALPFTAVQQHYNAFLQNAQWSDVQAFEVLDASGFLVGVANSVLPGTNTSIAVVNEVATLNSFITLQQAGTIKNGDMLALNVFGSGATVTTSGQIGTLNIPGISLSGTAIYDLEVGTGVGETIVSGKGTLLNTGVLAIGTGTGSISLGSGLTLASNTLSASGGGGGGGGINFGQLATPTASQTLLVYPVGSGGLTLQAGLPGSSAYAETAPTAPVTITLYDNATAIGTVNWAAGSNAGTITFTSGVTIASGGVLKATFQVTPDATFANFGVVLVPVSARMTGTYVDVSTNSLNTPYQNTSGGVVWVQFSFSYTAGGVNTQILVGPTSSTTAFKGAIIRNGTGFGFDCLGAFVGPGQWYEVSNFGVAIAVSEWALVS